MIPLGPCFDSLEETVAVHALDTESRSQSLKSTNCFSRATPQVAFVLTGPLYDINALPSSAGHDSAAIRIPLATSAATCRSLPDIKTCQVQFRSKSLCGGRAGAAQQRDLPQQRRMDGPRGRFRGGFRRRRRRGRTRRRRGGMPNGPPWAAPSVSGSPGWSSDPQVGPAGSACNSGAASAPTAAATTAPGAVALSRGPLRLRWPLQAGCEGQRPTRPRRVGGVGSGLACSALVSYPRLCLSQ